VIDVALRLGIALAAGAVVRMAQVFGVPWLLALPLLGVAGGFLSYRLQASRIFVVMAVSAGHFCAYMVTRHPDAASASADNPTMWLLLGNAFQLFLPFLFPPLGSIIALQKEKREAKQKAETEEITEESLLEEAVPSAAPVSGFTYDLDNLDWEEPRTENQR
jgi:hypothetical protein